MDMDKEVEGKKPYEFACESRITGKLVRVRHATEADVVYIREKLNSYRMDSSTVDYGDYVVADEDGVVIGFSTMEKVGTDGSHISVFVEERQNWLAGLIVKHLLEHPRKG